MNSFKVPLKPIEIPTVIEWDEAVTCLDCKIIFSVRWSQCPRCGGDNWACVARWLEEVEKRTKFFHDIGVLKNGSGNGNSRSTESC